MSTDLKSEPVPELRLSFYTSSRTRHDGELLCEWLLEQAHSHGCSHGMIVRATAGFTRHGRIHEEQFFELTDDLPVKLELLFDRTAADAFVQSLRQRNIHVAYSSTPITFERLNAP